LAVELAAMSLLRRLPFSAATAALLAVIAFLYLARATRLFDVTGLLALAPSAVWGGQLWRPLSASLLANGLFDLLFSGVALIWVSSELERFWRPTEWLLYVALCGGVAGLGACALFPQSGTIPASPAILLVALLVARVRLAPHERIHLSPTISISVAVAALLWAGMILVSALMSGMPLPGLYALAASAATGWAYLTLRWSFLHRQSARAVSANRFGRLEL